ncbi:hypothetical protein [Flagellimonas myxillae]|uniref:hypothetical protein n=1 Tax=Flagellimonas myxillae TaxID=2942214 RepID=UPI00201EA631|nr:hypothetical protein [Muricauda myxillae]MCL6266937.1 hypothetical protein [Muricauda myxillae]
MKNLNNTIFFLIVLSFTTACSSDDTTAPDAIVGEWITVQYFRGDREREVDFCSSKIVNIFRTDGSAPARWTTGETPPTGCENLSLSSLQWEHVGDNQWEVGTGVLVKSILSLQGNLLRMEDVGSDRVFLLERY